MKHLLKVLASALVLGFGFAPAEAASLSKFMIMTFGFGRADVYDKEPGPKFEFTFENVDYDEYFDYVIFAGVGVGSRSGASLNTFDLLSSLSFTNITDAPLEMYFHAQMEGGGFLHFYDPWDVPPQPGYIKLGATITNADLGYLEEIGGRVRSTSLYRPPYDTYGSEDFDFDETPWWYTFTLEPGASTTFTVETKGVAFMPAYVPLPAGGMLLLSALLAPLTWRRLRRGASA